MVSRAVCVKRLARSVSGGLEERVPFRAATTTKMKELSQQRGEEAAQVFEDVADHAEFFVALFFWFFAVVQ